VGGADIYERPSAAPFNMPLWFRMIRRLVIFLLGVVVIIEGLVSAQDRIVELIAGMVMVGVLPLDDFIRALRPTKRTGGLEVGRSDGPEPANLPSDQTGEPIDPGPSDYRRSP
jgi:hypothetical protein